MYVFQSQKYICKFARYTPEFLFFNEFTNYPFGYHCDIHPFGYQYELRILFSPNNYSYGIRILIIGYHYSIQQGSHNDSQIEIKVYVRIYTEVEAVLSEEFFQLLNIYIFSLGYHYGIRGKFLPESPLTPSSEKNIF